MDLHTVEPTARVEFISGLRGLAQFLSDHDDVPVPAYGMAVLVNADGTDGEQRSQVEKVASLLDVTPADGVHYVAQRSFGPVEYRFVAIPAELRARHEALMSYRDAVTPVPHAEDDRGRLRA